MTSAAIPRFFLYGEAPRHVGERFLHLEALDDRSRPANWNIRPHLHANLNHIFFLPEGDGQMDADGRLLPFQAPCLLVVPAGTVHGFVFGVSSRGSVLTISDSYLQVLTRREQSLAGVFAAPGALHEAPGSWLAGVFERLAQELAWAAPGHEAAVEALLLTVLVEAMRLTQYAQGGPRRAGPQAALVARFRERLEQFYRTESRVQGYAEALGVTARSLRTACLVVSNATPGRIIQERLLLEAKRLLLYSNMTVAEAAYYLGFEDPAYFTRFFTRGCGVSPRRFRQSGGELAAGDRTFALAHSTDQ